MSIFFIDTKVYISPSTYAPHTLTIHIQAPVLARHTATHYKWHITEKFSFTFQSISSTFYPLVSVFCWFFKIRKKSLFNLLLKYLWKATIYESHPIITQSKGAMIWSTQLFHIAAIFRLIPAKNIYQVNKD